MMSGRSIRQRLMRILLTTSAVVVTVTCLAFLVHEFVTFRATARANLETLARVTAANSTAALAFQDTADAAELLMALGTEPQVVAAALYDRQGRLFASYLPPGQARVAPPLPVAPGPDGYRFGRSRLVGFEPVAQPGAARLGTLYLESSLEVLSDTLRVAGFSALLVTAVSLLLAYVLARALQRTISQPIIELTQTATSVSDRQDYSVRAPKVSADEIGRLTDAFNQMLSRIEEQDHVLRTAVHARDVFIGVASHELRTPLTSLHLQVATLQPAVEAVADATLREKLARKLGVVARQTDRLTQLVENLLDVSRAMSGRFELAFEEFDLREVVLDVVGRNREQAMRAGCSLEVEADSPCPGRWDRLRVEQVLTNLLANAIKFGFGKPIDVTVECEARVVRIAVRDRGMGIRPEDQQRIFERFEQAGTPRPFGGLGLGLWIVRQILRAMGGTIAVTSQPGAGSVFTVAVPRDPGALAAPAALGADREGATP